jgi:hypothetical protein
VYYFLYFKVLTCSRGGDVDPHILVKWIKQDVTDGSDPIASMIIFEWKDYDLIGIEVRTPGFCYCWMKAELLYRMNTYVTRIRYKLASVLPTRRASSS